jgi:hypothetical protein
MICGAFRTHPAAKFGTARDFNVWLDAKAAADAVLGILQPQLLDAILCQELFGRVMAGTLMVARQSMLGRKWKTSTATGSRSVTPQ